mgnify:CR=1 FL=1
MSKSMKTTLNELCQKDIATASDAELYTALLKLVQEQSQKQIKPVTGRKLYYISAEFLIGKLLSNNLINLGLYDEVRETLASIGKSLADIEEQEPEPSLGNGGLGRLAACFLDSLATLDLPGDGVGLRYHCGLFHQNFKNNIQNEAPDFWLTDQCAAKATDTVFPVSLAGNTYSARLYKLPVTGYEGRTNMLNLFDLDSVDESVIGDGISFDKKDIARNLTLFLYPDDSDEDGRLQALLADADDAELEVDVAALNEEHALRILPRHGGQHALGQLRRRRFIQQQRVVDAIHAHQRNIPPVRTEPVQRAGQGHLRVSAAARRLDLHRNGVSRPADGDGEPRFAPPAHPRGVTGKRARRVAAKLAAHHAQARKFARQGILLRKADLFKAFRTARHHSGGDGGARLRRDGRKDDGGQVSGRVCGNIADDHGAIPPML